MYKATPIPVSEAAVYTDVSDEIKYKGRKSLPGFSTEELWHQGQRIGMWGSFGVTLYDANYEFTQEKEVDGPNQIVRIFQKQRIEPQIPLD